jgi:prepilin-type N-terminal cleavage/methylation domain-containing protein
MIVVTSMGQLSKEHAGFTLLELLIVIVAIGILATIVIFFGR